jgi:hypothetical protein
MVLLRTAARDLRKSGLGPTSWARLHWLTLRVMSAIIAVLLVLIEVRPEPLGDGDVRGSGGVVDAVTAHEADAVSLPL